MRKLIQFLKKFRDFIIFLLLQFFFLTLFFNSKNYHKAQLTNTSSEFVGWFLEKKYNISKHFNLSDANIALMEENAELRARMPESFYRLQGRIFYVNDTLVEQQYDYIPAEVINSTSTKRDNYFTLNRGKKQGIREGMGVISGDGAVGFVIDVSNHYATVKTLLSENVNVVVKHKKNNEHWLIKWDGDNDEKAQINGVTGDIDISVGDTIVTRGGGTMFPEGIMVGTVDELIPVNGKTTLNVSIKLSVNFSSVYHVYVIRNIFREEQQELENRLLDNE